MDKATLSAEPLSVSPSRLTTISALRDTVGTLEAEFTQFQIVSSGDIQQLKDKIVKQDNFLKLQKKTIDNIASDLSSQVKSLSDTLLQQSTLLKKLQEENQLLQKQKAKLTEENAILVKKQSELEKDVAFLKEQVGALWQKPADNSKSHPLEPDHPLELDQKCRYDEPKPKFTHQETRNIVEPVPKFTDQDLLLVNYPQKTVSLFFKNQIHGTGKFPHKKSIPPEQIKTNQLTSTQIDMLCFYATQMENVWIRRGCFHQTKKFIIPGAQRLKMQELHYTTI